MKTTEHIDPAALVVETNIRTAATPDRRFVASMRAHGVLTPVLGWRDDAGAVHLRTEQRRTLAARKAGLATVPIYVVDATELDTADAAGRIVEQWRQIVREDPGRARRGPAPGGCYPCYQALLAINKVI